MPSTYNTSVPCPYCNNLFDKRPQRKKKCPSCGNFVYIRTHPSTREKVIVTEEQMKEIDQEWKRVQSRKGIINTLSQFGIAEQDFINYETYYSNYYRRPLSDRETFWVIMYDLLSKISDFHILKMLYYQMALFLDEEGQDFYQYLRKSGELQLHQYRNNGVTHVKILVVSDACPTCKRNEGNVVSLEYALMHMPIPNTRCTRVLNNGPRGFCRCHYLPVR